MIYDIKTQFPEWWDWTKINVTISSIPHNMNLQVNMRELEISSQFYNDHSNHSEVTTEFWFRFGKVQYDQRYTSRVIFLDSALTTFRSQRYQRSSSLNLTVVDLESRVFCTASMLHYILKSEELWKRIMKSSQHEIEQSLPQFDLRV